MHDPGAPGIAAGAAVAREGLRERSVAVRPGRVHDDAGGLVDDDQLRILVSDDELRELAGRVDHRNGRRRDHDRLAAAQPVVLARPHPVQRDRAGLDPPLRLGARAEVLREELVDPFAGGLRRYAQWPHRDQRR